MLKAIVAANGTNHAGDDWPVQLIRDILDLRDRHGWGNAPPSSRSWKKKTYSNGRGATDYLVGRVLALAKYDVDVPPPGDRAGERL